MTSTLAFDKKKLSRVQELQCVVLDKDLFSKRLLSDFISKTYGLREIENSSLSEADVVFVDAALYDGDYMIGIKPTAHIVVVSSSNTYIQALFEKQISDFIRKPEMSYKKFLNSIERLRKRISA